MYRLNIYTDYLNWVCPETAYCTQIQWCVIIFPTKIIQNTLRLPQIWSDAFFFTLIHFQVLSCKCILYISIQYIHIYIVSIYSIYVCIYITIHKIHIYIILYNQYFNRSPWFPPNSPPRHPGWTSVPSAPRMRRRKVDLGARSLRVLIWI